MSIQPETLTPLDGLVEQFVAMQLNADRSGALDVVETALRAGFSVPEILLGLIAPSQYELGRRWERDEISVADEHIGTAISQVALSRLYSEFPRHGEAAFRVVVACVEGESHEIGARIVADLCEFNGLTVTYLGANVPRDSVMAVIERIRPDAVLLSVTMTWNVPALIELVERINAFDRAVRVIVGGLGLQWLDAVHPPGIEWRVFDDPLEAISQVGSQLADGQ